MFSVRSCLETLGDAYFARGAYTSAIKTFQRALEVNVGSLYSQIRIASIQQVSFLEKMFVCVFDLNLDE